MNNSYYGQSSYQPSYVPNQGISSNINMNGNIENNKYQYFQNVIYSNKGKNVSIFMSFPDSIEWRDKIFTGTIEEAGMDYILIKENDQTPVLVQTIYINYIQFNEAVN